MVEPVSLDQYKELPKTSVSGLNRQTSDKDYFADLYPTDDGRVFYESWFAPQTPSAPDDRYTVIGQGEEGRLDVISQRIYGTPRWWWILAVYNDIFDAFEEATSGRPLRYPAHSRLIPPARKKA